MQFSTKFLLQQLNAKSIFKVIIYILVAIFLIASFNYGLSNNFGLADIKFDEPTISELNETYTYKLEEEPTDIEINWTHGNITIITTNSDTYSIQEKSGSSLTDEQKLEFTESDDSLTINWIKPADVPFTEPKDLIVTIPKKGGYSSLTINSTNSNITLPTFIAEEISCDVKIGDISAESLTCESLSVSTDDGDITLENVLTSTSSFVTKDGNQQIKQIATDELNSRSSTGDIFINGDIVNTNTFTMSGNIDFTSTTPMTELSISTIDGVANVQTCENDGFVLDKSDAMGEVNITGFTITETEEMAYHIDNLSENVFSLSTSIGSVSLDICNENTSAKSYDRWISQIRDEERREEIENQQSADDEESSDDSE